MLTNIWFSSRFVAVFKLPWWQLDFIGVSQTAGWEIASSLLWVHVWNMTIIRLLDGCLILNNSDIISCRRAITGEVARVKHCKQVSASYLLSFDGPKPIRPFRTLRAWSLTPRRRVPDPWSWDLYCSFRSVSGGCCGKNLFLLFSLNMKTKFHLIIRLMIPGRPLCSTQDTDEGSPEGMEGVLLFISHTFSWYCPIRVFTAEFWFPLYKLLLLLMIKMVFYD